MADAAFARDSGIAVALFAAGLTAVSLYNQPPGGRGEAAAPVDSIHTKSSEFTELSLPKGGAIDESERMPVLELASMEPALEVSVDTVSDYEVIIDQSRRRAYDNFALESHQAFVRLADIARERAREAGLLEVLPGPLPPKNEVFFTGTRELTWYEILADGNFVRERFEVQDAETLLRLEFLDSCRWQAPNPESLVPGQVLSYPAKDFPWPPPGLDLGEQR